MACQKFVADAETDFSVQCERAGGTGGCCDNLSGSDSGWSCFRNSQEDNMFLRR